jgi:hypothetical protein
VVNASPYARLRIQFVLLLLKEVRISPAQNSGRHDLQHRLFALPFHPVFCWSSELRWEVSMESSMQIPQGQSTRSFQECPCRTVDGIRARVIAK